MMKSTIDLKIEDSAFGVQSWTFSENFRIGRTEKCELTLDNSSVSRRHAYFCRSGETWKLRDLGSRNGTMLNGERLRESPLPLCSGDTVTIGCISMQVEIRQIPVSELNGADEDLPAELIETVAHESLEKVLQGLVRRKGELHEDEAKMFALLRAGFHLGNHHSEEELVDRILGDALHALDAQRGAFVLRNDNGELEVNCVKTSAGRRIGQFSFSRNLAQRCLNEGKSILCPFSEHDSILRGAASVLDGQMNSILCVLLRTPRKRLGVLHLDRHIKNKPFTHDDLQLADALAASVSAGLESAQLFRQQQDLFLGTLTTLAQAVELRDPYTAGHAQRVTDYSLILGRQLDLTAEELHWIAIGTPLHDIGKIGVPDSVLLKPDQLTPDEFEIMKTHAACGEELLKSLGSLFSILPIVRSHHERWDGGGYPDGLAFEAIPKLARVVAVTDSFDAMTTDRPYRDGMNFQDAADEIRQGSGTQFDPDCAEAFFEIRDELEDLARRNRFQRETDTPAKLDGTDALPFLSNMPSASAAN